MIGQLRHGSWALKSTHGTSQNFMVSVLVLQTQAKAWEGKPFTANCLPAARLGPRARCQWQGPPPSGCHSHEGGAVKHRSVGTT